MLDVSVPLRKASMTARQRWTILVASTGGAIEVFDFVIYGFFARNIGSEFFPPRMGVSAMTLSFMVLAIDYLSRPLGGLILGRFGHDRFGFDAPHWNTSFIRRVGRAHMGASSRARAHPGVLLGGELKSLCRYCDRTESGTIELT